jgi:hypothetical protein
MPPSWSAPFGVAHAAIVRSEELGDVAHGEPELEHLAV